MQAATNPGSRLGSLVPRRGNLRADAVAGLTFSLVNMPQSMAHALLAAVNPVFGLYTLMIAPAIGTLFAGSVFMSISTTSALAVAAGDTLGGFPDSSRVTALVTLVVLTGILQIVMGVLKLGWLTRFIPYSVMTGFMTGVAVLVIIGQLGDFTGYYSTVSGKVLQVMDLILNRQSIDWATLIVGLTTLGLIYVLSRTKWKQFAFIIALLAGSVLAVLLNQALDADVKTVQDIASVSGALPSITLPSLRQMLALLLPAAALAIIGVVQGAGVSQTFPNPDGKFSDVSRDFMGQGIANVATGFISGIPAGGSSSGTALIVSSGAASRWAHIFASLIVLIGVLLFGRLVEAVAMPVLAALVIVAGIQMIKPKDIHRVSQTGWIPRIMMVITFGSTLVMPLQYAVFLGVGLSLLLFVFQQSNALRLYMWEIPDKGFPIERPLPDLLPSRQITAINAYGSLFYAAAAVLEEQLPDPSEAYRPVVILMLRGRDEVGSTVIGVLTRYFSALQMHDGRLLLAGVGPELYEQLERTGMVDLLGENSIFRATENLGEALNAALEEGRAWLAEEAMPDAIV